MLTLVGEEGRWRMRGARRRGRPRAAKKAEREASHTHAHAPRSREPVEPVALSSDSEDLDEPVLSFRDLLNRFATLPWEPRG